MSLVLHSHPLASFGQKALIALYENATPFTSRTVDLGDQGSRAAFTALWPMAKMPVLRDEARGVTVPESTVVIEYLDAFYPGAVRFVPADPDAAWRTRLMDRFFDHYVQHPMQKIVLDRLRPEGERDPRGVEEARGLLARALDWLDAELDGAAWAAGEQFSLADCAAAPALFYAGQVMPFTDSHPTVAAYFRRLEARPAYARVLAEAEPWMRNFPRGDGS